MRPGSVVSVLICIVVLLGVEPSAAAQDFDEEKIAAALARKDFGPAPRLPDGHTDLGNAKGSWEPPGIGDMAGTRGGSAGSAQPEREIEVPFLPWAKAVYAERNANLAKDDPEGYCLPPGIPRMYATSFPFQIYQGPERILFVFEGGAHMWRGVHRWAETHPAGQAWSPSNASARRTTPTSSTW